MKLANNVINSRDISIRGQNAISIGIIVSRAAYAAHDVASRLALFRFRPQFLCEYLPCVGASLNVKLLTG